MDKKLDTVFSVVLVLFTIPLLGIALALFTINPFLILTALAGILSFGLACIGLSRLKRIATTNV